MFTFIAFSAALAFLLGCSRLLRARLHKGKDNEWIAVLFFASTVVLLHLFLELSGRLPRFPHFALLHIPAVFLTGPLMYFYFHRLTHAPVEVVPPAWPHFLPAAISFLVMAPFYLRDGEAKRAILLDPNRLADPTFPGMILIGLGVLSNVMYLGYLILAIYRLRRTLGRSEAPRHSEIKTRDAFVPFLALLSVLVVVVLSFAIGQLLFAALLPFASVGLGILFAVLFLFSESGTDRDFKVQSRRARYAISRLNGINLDAVLARLDDLMREERVFLDEDLTLARLAEDLAIRPQQLSEILNTRMKANFRDFVNGFRLEEAASLLKQEPNRSVLSIAYAAGFNSKSSFHKLFARRYGCSPADFRKRT
ncbi:MAG: AraC family transcriptional regulator [Leptospirales bacterium]|nr:AraC family transcriptional regulator [Leptospirales bacterium]